MTNGVREEKDYATWARPRTLGLGLVALTAILLVTRHYYVLKHDYESRTRGVGIVWDAARQREVDVLAEASSQVAELRAAVASFRTELLVGGMDAWVHLCAERTVEDEAGLEQTVRPNFERRYHAGAAKLRDAIGVATQAGIFSLPLAEADLALLRPLVSLQEELQAEPGAAPLLDCNSEVTPDRFQRHAQLTRAAESCLEQFARLGVPEVRQRFNAGKQVCSPDAVPVQRAAHDGATHS